MQWKMTFKFGHFETLEFILCFTAKLYGLYGTQENATLNPPTHFLIKHIHIYYAFHFFYISNCN